MKTIRLTQGESAKVDDEFHDFLSQWQWQYSQGYARRTASVEERRNGRPTQIWMHREVLGTPEGMQTDHINGDRSDNRRVNLRVVTGSQNQMNAKRRSDSRSPFKGVTWDKRANRWVARLVYQSKRIYVGYFKDSKDAAIAYDNKVKELLGEYAWLNEEKHNQKTYTRKAVN